MVLNINLNQETSSVTLNLNVNNELTQHSLTTLEGSHHVLTENSFGSTSDVELERSFMEKERQLLEKYPQLSELFQNSAVNKERLAAFVDNGSELVDTLRKSHYTARNDALLMSAIYGESNEETSRLFTGFCFDEMIDALFDTFKESSGRNYTLSLEQRKKIVQCLSDHLLDACSWNGDPMDLRHFLITSMSPVQHNAIIAYLRRCRFMQIFLCKTKKSNLDAESSLLKKQVRQKHRAFLGNLLQHGFQVALQPLLEELRENYISYESPQPSNNVELSQSDYYLLMEEKIGKMALMAVLRMPDFEAIAQLVARRLLVATTPSQAIDDNNHLPSGGNNDTESHGDGPAKRSKKSVTINIKW